MTRPRSIPAAAAAVALAALVAAGCGDDGDETTEPTSDGGGATTTPVDTAESTATSAPAGPEPTGTGSGSSQPAGGEPVDLSAVCPSPLVIQTDWFAESEHGSLYHMLGDDYTVDTGNKSVTGPLMAGGQPTGVDLEIRSGGPAIGNAPPRAQIYSDDSIHMAYSNVDAQALSWEDTPMVALMAPLEINPQIIMWDPDTYPNVETIQDLGDEGVTINIFPGFGFADVFVAQGIWNEGQIDRSYDGSSARFIESGNIAQQGFASAEPYNYEHVYEEYGKRPEFQLLHEAGYPIYSQTLSVLPEDVEGMADCWERFIPIVQRSAIDFVNNPERTNAMIVDVVEQFDTFWVYGPGLAEYSVKTQLELGLVGNGPDETLGNFEEQRVKEVIDLMREADADIPDDLAATDMFTNEFIDESIGM